MQNPFLQIIERFDQLEKLIKQIELTDSTPSNLHERLSRKQIKSEYKISYATIHKLMNQGRLKYHKVGRKTLFKREDVETCFGSKKGSTNA